jgi:hypothetical protein
MNPRMADGIAALHPIPRLGTADEMAALAQFFLIVHDAIALITGKPVPRTDSGDAVA